MCRIYPSSSYYHLNSQYKIFSQNSKIDPESAVVCNNSNISSSVSLNNNIICGLFNNKYPLHIIPHPKKKNVFMNRISYDVMSDSYYENGVLNKKYIEFWDQGALYYENLVYTIYYSDDRKMYLKDTIALFPENFDLSASIIYKFDYSSCDLLSISSLNLKLNCYDDNTGYHLVTSISSTNLCSASANNNSNTPNFYLKNLKWNVIKETRIKNTNKRTNLSKNLTHLVKNGKIFYIKADILKKNNHHRQKNLQLFPYTKEEFSIKKSFGLDVKVELSPILLCNFKKFSLNFDNNNNIERKKNSIELNLEGGLFNDKYKFNVLPSKKIKNIYTHRISYNVVTNSYYENGKTDVKYLKRWDRGTFKYRNIYYSIDKENDYLSRTLSVDKKYYPAYITWKFDYRPGNFYINYLKLKLKFHHSYHSSNGSKKIQWLIQLLPTRKNPNPQFKPILLPLEKKLDFSKNLDYNLDLTKIAKDEYGFILKARLNGEKIQLFRQDNEKSLLHLVDNNFDMDVEVELKPNIIYDYVSFNKEESKIFKRNNMNEKSFTFNDKNTSDFIIKLELTKNDISKDNIEEFFYVHSKILTSKSDYFKALFNSQMSETQNRFLKLTDISYNIFEKLLLYIYNGNIESINNNFGDWVDLLYASSRFLIPTLVQICELSIRNFVNFDNLEEIKMIARECNAMQLVKYCEMYEI